MLFSPFSLISQEVIDEIVDYFSETKTTLLAFAMVCRTFRPCAQRHLLRHIRIGALGMVPHDIEREKQKLKDLRDILKNNPLITCYVKSITLHFDESTLWPLDDTNFLYTMDCISDAALTALDVEVFMEESRWAQPSPMDRLALPYISPFITKLALRGLKDVPITLITDCRQLRNLDISYTTFEPAAIPFNPLLRPRLEVFALVPRYNTTADTVDLLVGESLDLSQLRTLTTSCHGKPDSLRHILNASTESLEELSFEYSNGTEFSNACDLSRIPNLKNLKVGFSLVKVDGNLDPLADVSEFLRTISPENVMKKLSIDLVACSPMEDIRSELILPIEHLKQGEWSALDSVLIKISNGKRLDVAIGLEYCLQHESIATTALARMVGGYDADSMAGWLQEMLLQASAAPYIILKLSSRASSIIHHPRVYTGADFDFVDESFLEEAEDFDYQEDTDEDEDIIEDYY